jgi:aspartate aminotransferase
LAKTMGALQSHTTSNPATLSQHAALAALSNRAAADETIATMVAELRRRRDSALTILRDSSVDVIEPEGAFYLFLHVGAASTSDPEPGTTFARRLLEARDVAVVPGVAFRSPEWVRVSYAAPIEHVLEGMRRIISARIS